VIWLECLVVIGTLTQGCLLVYGITVMIRGILSKRAGK